MSEGNSSGETDGESVEKDTSSADSTERESIDEVPEYEGQWAALSDGESVGFDGDSDGSSDSDADDAADK